MIAQPPSTTKVEPVTMAASSEAKNMTVLAICEVQCGPIVEREKLIRCREEFPNLAFSHVQGVVVVV